MSRMLVFSDLDGTLLDHHTYDFEPARPMLERLQALQIPLILVTSKTRSEVETLQRRLGIDTPFVVENGAGAFIPADGTEAAQALTDSGSYMQAREFVETAGRRFGMRGFGDMDVAEVAALTGLDPAQAADAMKRDFTEPFVLEDASKLPELAAAARQAGWDVTEGGRFFHLTTRGQDKGHALHMLARHYAARYGEAVETIALGDSVNDFPMLEAADRAVLIPKPDGTYADFSAEGVVRAPYPGPRGWNAALKEILDACQK